MSISRSTFWSIGLGGLALGALAGLLVYFSPWRSTTTVAATTPTGAPPTEDPRLTYRGPYSNVGPDVGYVGDAACMECHPKETASFHRHPMGHSILPMSEFAESQFYDAGYRNPFEFEKNGTRSRFEVVRAGDRTVHRETRLGTDGKPVYVVDTPVDYVIGSGMHGHSYLSNRDGYIFQTPISWFGQKKIWDVSPGFDRESFAGRPIRAECLYCHANRVHHQPGSINHYNPPVFSGIVIGCERCHGAGELHIKDATTLNIVNPANKERMTPALRDAVCEQCHLEGEVRFPRRGRDGWDYRPGLPLDAVWAVFEHAGAPGEEYRAVSHVEQMHQSRCYLESSGDKKMTCVTCHNPHDFVEPARQPAYYKEKCLECHETKGCTEPLEARLKKSKDDNCVQCHMAQFPATDIVHSAATDHRILRTPTDRAAPPNKANVATAGVSLQPFYRERLDQDKELNRDFAIALVRLAEGRGKPLPNDIFTLLEDALRYAPDDAELWQSKAVVLNMARRSSDALAAYEKALALKPEWEGVLFSAATLSTMLGRSDKAIGYQSRLVALNPWVPRYRALYYPQLKAKGDWDEAREQSRAWLRLDPGSIDARQAWIECLVHDGKKDEARKEFAVIEALGPNDLGDKTRWFEKLMR